MSDSPRQPFLMPSDDTNPPPELPPQGSAPVNPSSRLGIKLAIAALFVVGVVALSRAVGHERVLEFLVARESQAQELYSAQPLVACLLAFLVYTVVTGISLPGAVILTLIYGWFFGWPIALLIVSFASTTGATIAFLTSRYFLRDSVQARFGARLTAFNANLEREGAWYLLTLRLLPVVPFFLINLVMGLTPLPARTFWWVSQIGMLPGTFVYTFAGDSLPDLATIQQLIAEGGLRNVLRGSSEDFNLLHLLFALILLGLLPVVVRFLLARFRRPTKASADL